MAVRRYTVQDGDDGPFIAQKFGFADTSAIWALPENAALRASRPNEHQLFPGDVVYIPERREQFRPLKEKAETVFRVAVCMTRVALVLRSASGRPLSGRPYELLHDGETLAQGTTGADGAIACDVPARCRDVVLRVRGSGTRTLRIGGVNPLRQCPDGGASGCAQRLRALGYNAGDDRESLAAAVEEFRRDEGLAAPDAGALDEALFACLERLYGQ